MNRLLTLMRRIVGRVKEYMNLTALLATLGVMGLPLGVYLLVEGGLNDRPFGYAIFITGIVMLLCAMWRVWREEKGNREEKGKRDIVEDNRFELLARILVEILDELKKLNTGRRNNERPKRKKQ